MATAQQAPDLNIPHSDATVEVSIIDTTCHLTVPSLMLVEPELPGLTNITACCYSFLIKHRGTGAQGQSKNDILVFDLGIRKDWQNSATKIVEQLTPVQSNLSIEKDVATILRENGREPGRTTFPSSTDLIVGPGFKAAFVPAIPTVPDSPVDERAWQERNLREIDFEVEGNGLCIGKFRAFDFYGDGSFYILDTPGHAIGHLCALARTTANPPTFMSMGGDIAHHAGELFQAIHPSKSRTSPFFSPASGEHTAHFDLAETKRSIVKLTEFDAYDDVFSVIAHDRTLFDIVDSYPKSANQ